MRVPEAADVVVRVVRVVALLVLALREEDVAQQLVLRAWADPDDVSVSGAWHQCM